MNLTEVHSTLKSFEYSLASGKVMKDTELLSQTAEENESLNHWDTFFSKRKITATYLSSQLTLKVFAKA